jgi:hypothetical protein
MIDTNEFQTMLTNLLKTSETKVEATSTVITPDILATIAKSNLATQAKVEELITELLTNAPTYCSKSPQSYVDLANAISILRNISMSYVKV